MRTLSEVETAAATLSAEDQQALVRHLLTRLGPQTTGAESAMESPPQGHSILDIEPVHLGRVLQPITPDDDLLGEMLKGRMNLGLDTGFLVAAEVVEHMDHTAARATLERLAAKGDRVALAPQVLAEFVHVVTDPRRFAHPLEIADARRLAEQWWTARDVDRVFLNDSATRQFLSWLDQFQLGRKRLLDTLLAATYHEVGIRSVLTTNPRDFGIFGVFTCVTPTASSASS